MRTITNLSTIVLSFLLLLTWSCGKESQFQSGRGITEDDKWKEEKYVILLVAGQSNAVGYDESKVSEADIAMESPDIVQLGYNGNDNLKIIPLGHCAQSFQNLATQEFTNGQNIMDPYGSLGPKSIHLPLASLILCDEKIVPSSYKLLVIPAAYGNTGFKSSNDGAYDNKNLKPQYVAEGGWRVGGAQYLAMRDRLKYVLDLNPENKYMGCVWIQGEADASIPKEHAIYFDAMVKAFNSFFEPYNDRCLDGNGFTKDIWWNVRSTCFWTGDFSDTKGVMNESYFPNAAGYREIMENYKLWNQNTFVTFDTDENDTNYITDGVPAPTRVSSIYSSHFGNRAYAKKVAPAIYDKIALHYLE